MPIKYIGRTTYYQGKRLFDILCRLKNFGIGRMVYRNRYIEQYPEPSYYVITRVDPDMSDPTQADPDVQVKSIAYGVHVFRGEEKGEEAIDTCYKADWKLVPRTEEAKFKTPVPARPLNIVPDAVPFPPLFAHFVMSQKQRLGKPVETPPKLPLKISKGSRAVYESEAKRRGILPPEPAT
jgi:hypothetical protein